MRKALSLVLASVILAGSLVDVHELSKLPYLIEHYNKHKDHVGRFSISEFVRMHYGAQAEQHDKEEHEQHEGLPFKSHDCSSIHSTIVLGPVNLVPKQVITDPVQHPNSYQSVFASEFHQSIWQPPRKG